MPCNATQSARTIATFPVRDAGRSVSFTGASGQAYSARSFRLHTIPERELGYYVVLGLPLGHTAHQVLYVGQLDADCGSLNLARMRHDCARLGGAEVAVVSLPETIERTFHLASRATTLVDLRLGLTGTLSGAIEPTVGGALTSEPCGNPAAA